MPFIPNMKNKTPLHLCYDRLDFKTAELFLTYLADAPIDHHGRDIENLIPKLLENDCPSLLTYLEKRMITTP